MKKILLILVLLFTSTLLYAVEIKLSCNITTKDRYGVTEKEHVIFIVTEFKDFVSIIPIASSVQIPSVTSKQSDNNIVFNNSNENIWSVTNKQTLDGKNYEQQIEIDRGTGQISFKDKIKSENYYNIFIGTGTCEKIDIKNKKF